MQSNHELLNDPYLSDADILDAMRHISGYLDITLEDFRTLYHLAYAHAIKCGFDHMNRMLRVLTEGDLRRLKVEGFIELMLQLIANPTQFSHRCHDECGE